MKKFLNDPTQAVHEMVEGFVHVHQHRLKIIPNHDVVAIKNPKQSQVGVVIGNGSGHEPACLGFVGEGMLTANAFGGLFAAPSPKTIYQAIKASDYGQGVCLLISNHAGDVLNGKMAVKLARAEGIHVEPVILFDDIASASKDEDPFERRGSVGTLFAYKAVGAYAAMGHTLEEVVTFAKHVRNQTRSLSISSLSGISPLTQKPFFELPDDYYEVGMGVHGETMEQRVPVKPSKEVFEPIIQALIDDKPYEKGDQVALIINSMGQTTFMESHIVYRDVVNRLKELNIDVEYGLVGPLITTQETAGIVVAICKLDETILRCLKAPTSAPWYFTKGHNV